VSWNYQSKRSVQPKLVERGRTESRHGVFLVHERLGGGVLDLDGRGVARAVARVPSRAYGGGICGPGGHSGSRGFGDTNHDVGAYNSTSLASGVGSS
jgi:hypothetical protein